MTISDFFSILTTVIGLALAFFTVVSFRVLKKLRIETSEEIKKTLYEMDFEYKRKLDDMERGLALLRQQHEALPCATVDKKAEASDSIASRLKQVAFEMFIMKLTGKKESDPFVKYVQLRHLLENKRETLSTEKFKLAVAELDGSGLEALIDWLNEHQEFEFSAIVRDEMKNREPYKKSEK